VVVVHSQTLPITSLSPKPLVENDPTGDVPTQPAAPVFWYGKFPCQVFAINSPFGLTSSPQA
jgi:hypothetical protein